MTMGSIVESAARNIRQIQTASQAGIRRQKTKPSTYDIPPHERQQIHRQQTRPAKGLKKTPLPEKRSGEKVCQAGYAPDVGAANLLVDLQGRQADQTSPDNDNGQHSRVSYPQYPANPDRKPDGNKAAKDQALDVRYFAS